MDNIIQFFYNDNQTIQFSIFIAVFIACWVIEFVLSENKFETKNKHALNNFLFSLLGAVVQILIGLFFFKLIIFENSEGIGLLSFFNIKSSIGQLIFSLIFLDFTYWVYHFLMHKIPFFWRFHAVHHSDAYLDVSTALREHPLETFIRMSHYILAVAFLGPYIWIISLHQFIQIVSKLIIHGDFRLSQKVDRILSYLLLTPNMHQVHHHYIRPYTDSNYGDLFSIWDRIFRTFYTLPKNELIFGLDQFPEDIEKPDSWLKLLKRPFNSKNYKKVYK